MGTYVSGAIAQAGAVRQRIAVTKMTVVQLAAAFASRITPASVGSLAVKVRFLQKSGLTNDEAVAGTALNGAGGGVARAVGVALALVLVGGSGFSLGDQLPSGWLILLVIVVVLAVVGIVVFTAIGHRLLEPVKRAVVDLVVTLRNPRKGVMLLGGALGVIVLNTIGFGLALAAVNAQVSVDTVIVVYVLGSTIGGAAPTPGGLGAVEAALVAGLTAAGTDANLAVAGVLSFRFLTYWLPIPLGYLALHRLRHEGLL